MRKTVAILGIPIDDLNTAEALERLEEFIRSGRFHQVATANTDFLIKAHEDPELQTILRAADLVVPDGMPVVMASRWLRAGLRERVTGADLVPALAKLAAAQGYTIFMLGARPEVAAWAKERLESACPGLRIVGCVSPPLASIVEMDNEALLAQIESAKPDILLVAFGNPKQEKWIHMHRHRLHVPVCIGVGGTFDFIAGVVPRAPEWMQRSGLEWLHRLSQNPRRLWKRYGSDFVHFASGMARQLWVMRRGRRSADPRLVDVCVGDCTVVSVAGPLDKSLLPEFQSVADQALNARTHLVLDLQATEEIDSAALGTLLNLPKRAAYVEQEVRLVGLNARLRRVLRVSDADGLLRVYPTVADALQGEVTERLDIGLIKDGRQAVLTLRGRADMEQVPVVEARLGEISDSIRDVDIDLQGVSYVDCGMLTTLRRFAKDRRQREGRVRLAVSEAVRRALARERLNGLFELTDAPLQIALPMETAKMIRDE